MSGHSKWANIKHKKGKSDAQKAKVFTKLGREIQIAVKSGGPDPETNSKLKDVIAKAKAANMPNDNITRSIKKASGDGATDIMEEITYEGYGPSSHGEAKGISFIRRFRKKDGSAVTNPSAKMMDQIVGPIGEPDERVTLVKLQREEDSEILIVHFATHPDVIGGTGICPDWPGFMRDAVERSLIDSSNGKGVRVIFFNGAQGDVNHHDKMNGIIRKGVEHSRHMGLVLAGTVLACYTYGTPIKCEKVFYKQATAKVGVAKGSAEQVKIASQIQERYLKNEDISDFPFSIVMARKYLRLEECEPQIDLNVACVGFGDVAFVGLPGEPFTQIGRDIKASSPFSVTMPCCNANGSEGYFPTDEALNEAGYESQSSLFLPGVATKLIDTSLKTLQQIKKMY